MPAIRKFVHLEVVAQGNNVLRLLLDGVGTFCLPGGVNASGFEKDASVAGTKQPSSTVLFVSPIVAVTSKAMKKEQDVGGCWAGRVPVVVPQPCVVGC